MKKDGTLKELMDGYIIVAGNNEEEASRNLFNTIGDYDIAMAMDREEYNVGLVKIVPEEPVEPVGPEEPKDDSEKPEEPKDDSGKPEEPIEEKQEEAVDTGDHNHMMLWFAFILMSGCIIAGNYVYRQRRKDEEE